MPFIELLDIWGLAALGVTLVGVAFLINRYAPRRRRRIRHVLLLYVAFLLASGMEGVTRWLAASHPGLQSWAGHLHVASSLTAAFTGVSLAGLFVFDFLLPVIRLGVVAITADVIMGFAYAFAALGVLRSEGVSPSSVVTTSAIASGVIALSLQATLGNILGGMALQMDGSVHVGDWLALPDGTQGKVTAIRWRHTVLETRNWDTVIVPNSNLLAQNIVILGKRAGQPLQHRMWVTFNVDFRYPPSQVIEAVQSALWAAPIEGIADEPKPNVICYDLAKDGKDSFGYYAVRYWLTDLPNDDPTNSRVRTRVYAALRRAGIPLARPSQTLFMSPEEDDTARAGRLKKKRVGIIERVELLRSLTPAERDYLADHLKYAPFTAGETITRQGSTAHFLYLLLTGQVEVRRRVDELVRDIAIIQAPGFFGEMGLLTGEPRAADVIALTDVECYRLDKPGLEQILQERPEIAEEISRTVAKRQVEMWHATDDADARTARIASVEDSILSKIQTFFGLGVSRRMRRP